MAGGLSDYDVVRLFKGVLEPATDAALTKGDQLAGAVLHSGVFYKLIREKDGKFCLTDEFLAGQIAKTEQSIAQWTARLRELQEQRVNFAKL